VWFARAMLAGVAASHAACGFKAGDDGARPADGATVDSTRDDATPIDGPSDGAPADAMAAPFCDGSDPDLDLCASFDTAIVDESMNDHSELSETGISLAPRAPGTYGVFLGSQSDLLFDDSIVLQANVVTIEGWIEPDMPPEVAVDQRIFDANGRFWMKLTDTLALECGIFGDSNSSIPNSSYPFEIDTFSLGDDWYAGWHHVACRYDGASLTAWIDGDCKAMAGGVDALADGSIGAAIGSNHNQSGVNEQFTGGIDNFRVWTRALGPQEICTAANQTNCMSTCE